MLKRFLEKRVDEDWLHTNFPCITPGSSPAASWRNS